MRRTIPVVLVIAACAAPVLVACSSQSQQPAQQPAYQSYTGYPATTGYVQPTGYPATQSYPAGAYGQPTSAATYPTQPAAPATAQPQSAFPFPIPQNLPAMIPSGLIPGFPAPTST